MTYRWFAYVLHSKRADYEAAGWTFSAELRLPHCRYSVLMEWTGEGDPPRP